MILKRVLPNHLKYNQCWNKPCLVWLFPFLASLLWLAERSLHLKKSRAILQRVPVHRHLVHHIGAHNGNRQQFRTTMRMIGFAGWTLARSQQSQKWSPFPEKDHRLPRPSSFAAVRCRWRPDVQHGRIARRIPAAVLQTFNDPVAFQSKTSKTSTWTERWSNFCRGLRHFQTVPRCWVSWVRCFRASVTKRSTLVLFFLIKEPHHSPKTTT